MELVSVIIPVFNIEREYLERCVLSVYTQDYPLLEVILVDDGATDDTGLVCDELVAHYSSGEAMIDGHLIYVYHKENGGSSSARNLGIMRSHGEYIGFVDSDDYVDKDFVSLMMDAMERNHVKMVQISRDEIDIDGNKRPDVCTPPESERLITAGEQMQELLMHRGDCSFCTRICARELFDGLEFPVGRLNEDFNLLVQMLKKIDKYVILPNQAYHVFYRIGSNSRRADKNDFSRVFMDIVDNADMAEELVAREYPELIPVAKRFALYQRLDYMLHIPVTQMRRDNLFYCRVVKYLRKNKWNMINNQYLTAKNKLYLGALTLAPVLVRRVHGIKMRIG